MSQVSRRFRQMGLVLSLLTLYLACPSVGLTQQDNNLIYLHPLRQPSGLQL